MPRVPLLLLALITAIACQNPGAPTDPCPCSPQSPKTSRVLLPPPPVQRPVTFSGAVYEVFESGATQQVPNLRLHVRAGQSGALGAMDLPDIVTDPNGRYTITKGPAGFFFFQTAASEQHRFLCEWFGVVATPASSFFDLPVVHTSWSGTKPPPTYWTPGGSVYGVVSESVNSVTQPLPGATVRFDNENADPDATTSSTGFYMICSWLGADQYRWLAASKAGYETQKVQLFGAGPVPVVNFLLSRQ